MSTNSAPSSPSAGLAYLQDTSEFLRSSTDMLIIVEGTALPCHKQVLAAHSKAFAAVAEQLTASLGHGENLRLEAPFKGKRLVDVQHLMHAIYRPEALDTRVDCRSVGGLLALAHQTEMPGLALRIMRMLLDDYGKDRMEPVSLDAALTWLQHCQRFNLCLAVPACEAMVTRQFLWAGKHRPSEMQALSSASLLRMSQAYARMQYALTLGQPRLDFDECGEHDVNNADARVGRGLNVLARTARAVPQ